VGISPKVNGAPSLATTPKRSPLPFLRTTLLPTPRSSEFAVELKAREVHSIRHNHEADAHTMELLKSGSHDAMEALFHRFHRIVFSVGFKMLRDRGEAEDVMQEVFMELYKKAHAFDPSKGSLKTWVLQCAYHKSLDRRQYLTVRKFYDSRRISGSDVNAVEVLVAPIECEELTIEERTRALRIGLEALSDKQRRVLELTYFKGLLLREIAEETGESLEQTRHHYYRGLKKLREAIRNLTQSPELGQKCTEAIGR
jgi:RNA polymerase sigma-70 factor, ECF subfamily